MDDAQALGRRLREVRCWRRLTLREAAGQAGLSFSFWGQVERGEKAVTKRNTLEAMAGALRVHPTELTGQPWTRQDVGSAEAHTGLKGLEIALERYELGVDPELPVRAWPQIQADIDRLVSLHHHVVDYTATGELAAALIGELQSAYLRLPQQRREVLLGLIDAHRVAMRITKDLGDRGLPMVAVRAVQQCAEALDDAAWLGCAAVVRSFATGELDRAGQYRRSVAVAETLTSKLDSSDALQAYGMLHLMAAVAAGARGDHDTSATHLQEASALAARMDTEVGTWANLWFGPTNVGEGVHVLVHAEQLAPQRIHHDLFVRETVADLLRQARREAGGRELRGLACGWASPPSGELGPVCTTGAHKRTSGRVSGKGGRCGGGDGAEPARVLPASPLWEAGAVRLGGLLLAAHHQPPVANERQQERDTRCQVARTERMSRRSGEKQDGVPSGGDWGSW